jgi:hypothetical protein
MYDRLSLSLPLTAWGYSSLAIMEAPAYVYSAKTSLPSEFSIWWILFKASLEPLP